ncbi:MAG TPA: SurA N-terminal domain-containing protein [Acetobacteraceae bacterium]|nr:SurA N-terminal domain-containing protein [Acetobacteraceae bacterium]
MLSALRNLLDNWLVRAFFALLIAVFVFWGISSAVTNIGSGNAVATVGGVQIDPNVVQSAYQQQLNRFAQRSGGKQPDAKTRRLIAQAALGQAIDREAMALEVKRLGVVAPPAALRKQIFAMSVFQGTNGQFDRARFNQVLQDNNLSPNLFMADLATSLRAAQVVQAVTLGAAAPAPLVRQVFDYIGQERVAAYVQLPFAAATPPPPPPAAVLRRYWRNHPRRFSTPALRRVQVVILSPELLASHVAVSQQEIAAAYARDKVRFTVPASRTVEIITASDPKAAASLLGKWKGGAGWNAMKQAASGAGATAVTFKDAEADQFPSGRLAKAVFAASPGAVSGPVQGALGTYLFKVTAVKGGVQPLSKVADQIRQQIALRRAQRRVDAAVTKVQDALAAATPLDKLPGSLGLAAVEGELDAQGMTAKGKPAPIPGPPALRQAIVKAAFATPPGTAPRLITAPGGSYYALSVVKEIPPALKPYHEVASAVLADWTGAQVAREEEVQAAKILAAVKTGKSIDQAAGAEGLTATVSQPMTRAKPAPGIPPKLMPILFTMKPGHATMVQTQEGFVVAVLKSVADPKPGTDPALQAKIGAALRTAMQTDTLQSFATALRSRYHVTVNPKILSQISS